jgi:type I restriction enzyme, S subunit
MGAMINQNNNWVSAKLTAIADLIMGQSPPSSSYNHEEDGLPFFQGNKDFGEKYPTKTIFTNTPKKISFKGDVLVSVRAPIGDVNLTPEKCCIGRGLAALRPKNGFDSLLLYYLIRHIQHELEEVGTGSTFKGISKTNLNELEVNYPENIDTQKQLALLVDKLVNSNNEAKTKVQRAQLLISKFRQAILSAAVMGRLTEEWRKTSNTKAAQDIIEEIREKRLLKSPAKKTAIDKIYSFQEDNDSTDLPDQWHYIALDKLCESFQYGTSTKSAKSGRVVVLRMGNLQNGEIDWSDLAFTSDDKEIEKYKLHPGDVLFNRTNSPELVGKTSIYRGEKPAIFAGYLIKINNYPELDSEYLNFFLNSGQAKAYCRQVKTDGVSQSNINAQKLSKFEIPFCSVEEQREIVKRAKVMLDVANKVEQQIDSATNKAQRLTQAILTKAFRGDLVTPI